ncbi:MAG TPA: STAS domain-containing protein [Oxalicibacterium sp.]|nr:STAS domain-containing protein [Oxalicibacterium sp.]
MSNTNSPLTQIIVKFEKELLDEWVKGLLSRSMRRDAATEQELTRYCAQFLNAMKNAASADDQSIDGREWEDVRSLLSEISKTRVRQGFSPIETANFVFSLKQPLFQRLRTMLADKPADLATETWNVSTLFDSLGLFTVEVYQQTREQVILRQQQELMELSTPVVQLWQNVLALPLIGTLDSARTQVVMENLLQKIIDTGAAIAIIDITGVPTVDTLVAQHLLKTIAAARLMGADCIISGIRPQIAQTIVHLGVNLEDVITKATLADAFLIALERIGATINSKTSR